MATWRRRPGSLTSTRRRFWPGWKAGETFTVTRNGRPLAILRPYGEQDPVTYSFRTDPMGQDDSVPTFRGPADFSERADELMAGFGGDE